MVGKMLLKLNPCSDKDSLSRLPQLQDIKIPCISPTGSLDKVMNRAMIGFILLFLAFLQVDIVHFEAL